MSPRILLLGAAALLASAIGVGSAYAYSEVEIIRLHESCRTGDRDVCVHRDAAIHDHDHETEWRRVHPEWYR